MAREIRPHGDIPHQNNSLRRRTYKSQFVLNLAKHKKVIIGSFLVVTIVVVVGVFLLGDSSSMDRPMSESTEKEVAIIETRLGKIVIELFPDKAPKHVENFKKLARDGFYDGITLHRVIPGFMIQGGDPNSKDGDRSNDGIGGPGYSLPQELNDISHVRGVLSMARSNADSGSQFFIMVGDAPHLDPDFSAFGKVTEGMDVADQISKVERDGRDNPLQKVEMKISILATTDLAK